MSGAWIYIVILQCINGKPAVKSRRNIISKKWQAVRIIFRPAALILASSEEFIIKHRGAWQEARDTQNHRQKYAGMKRRQTAGPRLSSRLIF